MGRCLAFNFSPDELRQHLQQVRWFAYSPDFDSAAGGDDQNFFAVVGSVEVGLEALKPVLIAKLTLRALSEKQNGRTLYEFSPATQVTLGEDLEAAHLVIKLYSAETRRAITSAQILDLQAIDAALDEMKLQSMPFKRYQDVVFGPRHVRAKELAAPFLQPGALFVPKQKDWFVGSTFAEAKAKFDKSFSR